MFIFYELPYLLTIKYTGFDFFNWVVRKCQDKVMKQSPTVGNAYTNCFFRPSFKCLGGHIIFFLSTSGSCIMLGSRTLETNSSPPNALLISAVPHEQKTGIRSVSTLLTMKKGHYFKVNTDYYYYYYYYYLKRLAMQGREREIDTLSVRRPQPYPTNL